AVFGLWHIRPTAGALAVNRLAAGRGARITAITAVAAGTAGAGAVFSLLRERSGSLAAPVLLHLAANCTGPLASALARRIDPAEAPRASGPESRTHSLIRGCARPARGLIRAARDRRQWPRRWPRS
ncbi:MAG: CPBP family glutamic-type intramembrane protease, partial [Streptosporangiaceae bacterium]